MAREKEDFRVHLELLNEAFPGRVVLTLNEVCRHLRKDPRTLRKDRTFPLKRTHKTGYYAVPLVGLARWLSS